MRKKEIQEIITEMRQINERLLKLIAEERGGEGKEIIADASDALEDAVSCLENL